jgi:hypothetical protein
VHAVGPKPDRGLDVVVDDERDAQVAEPSPHLDQLLGRGTFAAELDDSGAPLDGPARRLEVLDECVQLHEIRARSPSVAGSSAASAS